MPFFIGVQGQLGHGKTLLASVMAHYWAEQTKNAGGQVTLFANFALRDAIEFDHYEKWYEVADALGSIIIWDEAELQFDRRQWQRNVIEMQIMKMTRKLRSVHVFCTPLIKTLDGRLQDMLEVVINVRKTEGIGMTLEFYEYQDKRFGELGRLLKRKFIPWRKVKQIFRLSLYDTYQMVHPFQAPSTERDQINFLKTLNERHQAALVRDRSGVQIEDVKEG